jgi:hypothetical protein
LFFAIKRVTFRKIGKSLAVGETNPLAGVTISPWYRPAHCGSVVQDRRTNLRWGGLFQDVAMLCGSCGKNPGFTAVAVLTLALGIGANTAFFSVLNGVLLNPLPCWQPDRLVASVGRQVLVDRAVETNSPFTTIVAIGFCQRVNV